MTDPVTNDDRVAPGGARLIAAAEQLQAPNTSGPLGIHHWLLALVQRYGPLAESLTEGLNPDGLRPHLAEQIRAGQTGDALAPEAVIEAAAERARARGKPRAAERDIAAVILSAAGYTVKDQAVPIPTVRPPQATDAPMTGEVESAAYHARARRPTPTLEQYGRDLTQAALAGSLNPVVGRDEEIDLMMETLCRRTKRNPVLVGPAGVGKTAIVEGLAQRIVRGDVPRILLNTRLVEIQPSTLVAGAGIVGELNERMKSILAESRQDGLILFIDEVHSMVGAGGAQGTGDIASMLKPALARGDIACIAATTDDEYRRFIEPDAALERRFQPIRVQEITAEQTIDVLQTLAHSLAEGEQVHVGDEVIHWLVEFADQYLRNRTFPDKAVDLLEQCVAYALTHDKDNVTLVDAAAVAQRMIGMPLELDDRFRALRDRLTEQGLLSGENRTLLLERLAVTMRGLDVRNLRPNATVLLLHPTIGEANALALTIAGALFGSEDRVVTLDFGRMTQAVDITMLLGAPPGYVGYSDALALHRVVQMPWCVLLCEHVDSAHPHIVDVLSQGLAAGFITDAQGRRVYLSDAVVLLTADTGAGGGVHRPIGFQTHGASVVAAGASPAVADDLPTELLDQVDLVVARSTETSGVDDSTLETVVLREMAERYRKHGLTVTWEPAVLAWLQTKAPPHANRREWERLCEGRIAPRLVDYLPSAQMSKPLAVVIAVNNDALEIHPQT